VSERDVAEGAASGGGGGQCFGEAAGVGGSMSSSTTPMGSCHTNSLWSYQCSENNDSFGKVHRVLRQQ
jgi:hypothetical protein